MTLRPHIEKYHLKLYLELQKARGWKILLPGLVSQARSQAMLGMNSPQEDVLNFIVVDDQVCFSVLVWFTLTNLSKLLNIIECCEFRALLLLRNSAGCVSFTMDMWSDHNHRSYLAITAHWIGHVSGTTSLQFRAALIAFHRLQGSHAGKSLGKVILDLLDRLGVTVKV
ncbi:hypothetical protein BYT27DRAFT_7223827 [Phlegmacium glaucopus]|nr:hypothetical protein BYT27DRAFT_7223827 [Phlegmacium glaucopus]